MTEIRSPDDDSCLFTAMHTSLIPAVPDRIRLVWTHHTTHIFAQLLRSLLREISRFLGTVPLLISIQQQGMTTMNITTLHTDSVEFPFSVDSYSVWLQLSPASVFLCGSRRLNEYRPSYLISHATVTSFPGLNRDIRCPGAIYLPTKVYLFGGYDSNNKRIQSIFRFSPQNDSFWENSGELLRPRSNFNPCFSAKNVFLCGGYQSNCEIFDTLSQLSTLITEFSLPIDAAKGYSTSVIHENTLIIITNQSLIRYSLSNQRVIAVKSHEKYNSWSNMPPVSYNGTVFIVDRQPEVTIVRRIEVENARVVCENEI